jgi:hypothetical protein
MLCQETGSQEVVHVDMTTKEAQHISKALSAVRGFGQGNGEVCIPVINGLVKKLRIAIDDFIDQQKKH